jgi:KDO2-lipid IV(A) lauroyltransferase
MKYRPWYRAWPECAALIFGLGWIPFLPRTVLLALARGCGNIGYRFARSLRNVAEQNLTLVFGDTLAPAERERLLRRCFQHFALLVLDILWFSFRPRQRLARWFHWDPSSDVMFNEGAQLMLTAHYGNWETLGQAYAARGAPIFSVAAPLKNKPVDCIFIYLRQRTGQVIIPQQGAARKLLQGLRQGHKLAVLLDQNTRPRDGGVFVPFFGLPVPVSSAPAALAVKTKTPVLTVLAVPDDTGVYTVTVHDILHADPSAADPVLDLTQRMTRSIEKVILARPEPWCWMYTRWRHLPDGHDGEGYPAYAKR